MKPKRRKDIEQEVGLRPPHRLYEFEGHLYTAYMTDRSVKNLTGVTNTSFIGSVTILLNESLKKNGIKFTEDDVYLCTCGNNTFELRYGRYEILAKCTKCGKESSAYSG